MLGVSRTFVVAAQSDRWNATALVTANRLDVNCRIAFRRDVADVVEFRMSQASLLKLHLFVSKPDTQIQCAVNCTAGCEFS